MLRLEFPNESHKIMWEEIIAEVDETGIPLRHPDSIFQKSEKSYEDILEGLRADTTGIVSGRVPSTAFFLLDDEKIYGALSLRHHINHPNLEYRGGHIGYGIRPNERGRGYATLMMGLGLEEAKKLGLEKVLLTCQSENIGSKRVIEKNGGIFESEQTDEKGEKFLRYWITL